MKIDFFTGCNEYTKTYYRAKAEILDEIPQVGDSYNHGTITCIEPARMDCEQPNHDIWLYDVFEITVRYDSNDELEDHFYVAVEKPDDEDEDEPLTYPRRYRVKDGFGDAWYGNTPTDEVEAIQAAGMTIDEIRELAEGWDKPLEELMEQVEEI